MRFLRFLSIENFRLFNERIDFEFAPITLFVGANSSGKSSLMSFLRILHNCFNNKFDSEVVFFGGDNSSSLLFVPQSVFKIQSESIERKLGDFHSVISHASRKKEIKFSLCGLMNGIPRYLQMQITVGAIGRKGKGGDLKCIEITDPATKQRLMKIERKGERKFIAEINYHFFLKEFQKDRNYAILCDLESQLISGQSKYHKKTMQNGLMRSKLTKKGEEIKSKIEQKMSQDHPERHKNVFDDLTWLGNSQDNNSYIRFHHNLDDDAKPLYRYYLGTEINERTQDADLEEGVKLKKFLDDFFNEEAVYDSSKVTKEINAFFEKYADSISVLGGVEPFFKKCEEELMHDFRFEINLPDFYRFEGFSKCFELFGDPLMLFCKSEIIRDLRMIANAGGISSLPVNLRDMIGEIYKYTGKATGNPLVEYLSIVNLPRPNLDRGSIGFSFLNQFIRMNAFALMRRAVFPLVNFNSIEFSKTAVERYYRLDVPEENIAKLLQRLSVFDRGTRSSITEFIKYALSLFEMGESVELKVDTEMSIARVYVKKKREQILLADLGYGMSQLIRIIFSIASSAYRNMEVFDEGVYFKPSMLVFEEPEVNLHPSFQSKLADLLWFAHKQFKIQFLVETHSEYMVRKFQYLAAIGDLPTGSCRIYNFKGIEEFYENSNVKKININDDGSLSDDFYSGFFDEADRIAVSIWSMSQSRKN